MTRRILRIWPVYFLFIAVCGVWAFATREWGFFHDLPALLTFTYNYWIAFTGVVGWDSVGHLWSISAEQQFYLIFPFVFAFLAPSMRERVLWGVVFATPIVLALVSPLVALQHYPWPELQDAQAIYMFSGAHFGAFALGALIALNRARIEGATGLAWKLLGAALLLGLAYFATYASINFMEGRRGLDVVEDIVSGTLWGAGKQVFVYPVISLISAAFVFAVVAGVKLLTGFCNLPGLQWIGRISYGAYVFHAPMVWLVGYLMPRQLAPHWDLVRQLTQFVIAFALTIVLAYLSNRFFEQPILSARKRFG